LLAVALIGLGRSAGWRNTLRWLWMPLVIAMLAALWAGGAFKQSTGQVFEIESAYNYIQVIQDGEYRYLRLNDGQGVHSMYHPELLIYDGPWMQFLAGPFFNRPPFGITGVESIAIIGLAAGTTARQATAVFGAIPIDGFEIDPAIIEVGRQYFEMTMPNLNAIAQDGRWGLEHSERKYSLIAVDAYRPPYIPWHLTTQEFFAITRERLTEDGVTVINVGRAPGDRSLIDALVTTLQAVYPSVHVMDIPGTFNSMVYATAQPTSFDNLAINYNALALDSRVHPLLVSAIDRVLAYRQPTPEASIVFTDDKAPVEWIINNMVLRFVLSGEYQDLQ
jgi:spermidine synthase